MVLDFYKLVLMRLDGKLYFYVLLELLSAVYLIENKFIVKGFPNDMLEFVFEWLEIFVHLENVLLTIYNVHKFGVKYLLLHPEVDGLDLFVFFLKFFLLLKDLCDDPFLVLLLFVVLLPEFSLDPVHLPASQFKELLGSDRFLLVEVASQLKLLFNMDEGVLNVVHVLLHLLHLLFRKVLQHLDIVVRAAMVLKALSAQGLRVAEAIVDIVVLVLGANVVIADDSAGVNHGPKHRFHEIRQPVPLHHTSFGAVNAFRATSSSCEGTYRIHWWRELLQVHLRNGVFLWLLDQASVFFSVLHLYLTPVALFYINKNLKILSNTPHI